MNKLDLGAFRVEHVPGEPFLIVCPKSPKQEKELFSDFTEDIEAGVKRARQLSERDGVGLTHVFGEVGRSTTHVYILSAWVFAENEAADVMPFMMLAEPHLEQAAIKRIRETWERCTDGEEFVNPPWDDVIQKVMEDHRGNMTPEEFGAEYATEVEPAVFADKPNESGFCVAPGQVFMRSTAHSAYGGKYCFPLGVKDPGDTKSAGFECSRCGGTVRRTKRGLKPIAYSCKCFVAVFHHTEKETISNAREWRYAVDAIEGKQKHSSGAN